MSDESNAYWQANLRLILWSLVVWAVVSFGFGIILRPLLKGISVGGTDFPSSKDVYCPMCAWDFCKNIIK